MTPEIQEYLKKAKEAAEAMKKIGKDAMNSLFVAFFEQNPEVAAVAWTQCTPYFNDGDPCEFSVSRASAYLFPEGATSFQELGVDLEAFTEECSGSDYDEDVELNELTFEHRHFWGSAGKQSKLGRQMIEINNLLTGDLERVCYEVFGDHAKVVVTREGIFVSAYDHD